MASLSELFVQQKELERKGDFHRRMLVEKWKQAAWTLRLVEGAIVLTTSPALWKLAHAVQSNKWLKDGLRTALGIGKNSSLKQAQVTTWLKGLCRFAVVVLSVAAAVVRTVSRVLWGVLLFLLTFGKWVNLTRSLHTRK